MKNILVLIILLVSSTLSYAQLENAKIEQINGVPHYVHTVEAGNTLWGIQKTYGVPVAEIVNSNPGVENGIKEGQIVYIPLKKKEETIHHKVEKGETLFGISRKYDVSVEQLLDWNPEAEKGLSIDQVIKIYRTTYEVTAQNENEKVEIKQEVRENPFTGNGTIKSDSTFASDNIKVTFADSVISHVVMPGETFYSISKRFMVSQEKLKEFNNKKNTRVKEGEVLKIPLKQERIEKVEVRDVPDRINPFAKDSIFSFSKKEHNNVAILLPFYLDKGKGYSEYVSNLATEFYMGAQMALDSLKAIGFNADVFVYDTRNDSTTIASILNKPEFQNMDLIIGPLFKDKAQMVAAWCKENQVRMVCPSNVDAKILKNNPFVYTSVPSDITLIKGLAKYTHETHQNDKIILVKSAKKQDSILYQAFRDEFYSLAKTSNAKLIESTPTGFTTYLTRSANVIIVYPTNDKSNVVKLFNEMGRFIHKTHDDKTFVFGTNEWKDFEEVSGFHKNKFKMTFSGTLDLNYNDPTTNYYTKKYRNLYDADFSKMAVQGFDVTLGYCSQLLMENSPKRQVMNNINFKQVGEGNGYENQSYFILSQREYELINVARP